MDKNIVLKITINHIFKNFGSIDLEKSVPRAFNFGTNNSCFTLEQWILQRLDDMHRHSCQNSSKEMPQFIDCSDWWMMTFQLLGNHWPDFFYWWDIRRTWTLSQQLNIFYIKESPDVSATCKTPHFSRARIKTKSTGLKRTEIKRSLSMCRQSEQEVTETCM